MRYLSVCSGIEAATVAWHPLGWEPVGFSEIDPFASTLLAERYPNVPNLGDMTKYASWNLPAFDLLVGGTPCQSFSVAGLRKGLEDPRGNLALVYLGILDRFRPRWVVWENVPGVLSSNGGRDFGTFLGALGELGYGWSYRVLDAQFVRVESHPRAVPQRRQRVFVVGHSGGDWHSAAQVLLEPEGVRGDSAPRREAGKGFARGVGIGSARGGQPQGITAIAFNTKRSGDGSKFQVSPTMMAESSDPHMGGRLAVAFKPSHFTRGKDGAPSEVFPPLSADADKGDQDAVVLAEEVASCIDANYGKGAGSRNGAERTFIATGVPDPAYTVSGRSQGSGRDSQDTYVIVNVEHALHASNNENSFILRDFSETLTSSEYKGHSIVLGPDRPSVSERGQAVAHTLSTQCDHATEDGTGRGSPLVVQETLIAVNGMALCEGAHGVTEMDVTTSLQGNGGKLGQGMQGAQIGMAVRRLTPRECERLQGFPDDYTLIEYRGKDAADGNRYKSLGNSMAVNVMRFIGERIHRHDPPA